MSNQAPRPKTEKSPQHQFPEGQTITWSKGDGPAMLNKFHSPTIQVTGDVQPPIEFDGSFDGVTHERIRDIDGDPYRVTRPGVFHIPVNVAWLWPAINSDATVKIFIGR